MASTCKNSLLYKNFHRHPAALLESTSGIYLQTSDGRNILDATSGAAVACLGYSNKEVQQAVIDQLTTVPYCHPGFYKTQSADDLADFLVQSTDGQMSKAVLCGSGSEAVEVALKLAKTHFSNLAIPQPERSHFIARVGAWHGATLGALTLGDFKVRKDPFLPLIAQTSSRVSACSTYRGLRKGEDEDAYVRRLAQELDDEFQRIGPHKVCAFVAETVGGSASGCAMPVKGYFPAIKAVCEKYGALLILDEVMCGMGRTGSLHAWEQEDVVPDLLVVGKGLGAGYAPISAVLVNSRLVNSFQKSGKSFAHGQTYMAHPQAAAAGLKVQQIIRDEDLVSRVKVMGEHLEKRLKERFLPHPYVGDVRGRGLFWAIEFVMDKESKVPFPSSLELHGKMHSRGMRKGYEVALFNANGGYDGYAGDHFLICPPFIVTEADIDEIVDRTARVIDDTFAELASSSVWDKIALQMDMAQETVAQDTIAKDAPVANIVVGEQLVSVS
ncbi:PLP-dependent transferase [Sodiomyces alkalinus F11]|uniref:PLP-dependent transferase n=1 Tax=Sodiomyces alkalinus (strain CBS 110278 / VKM F-3762 / F11) TaxID=1314773 RepID=A0A3N2PIX2_SODAK|nr:PLP-dependent transferase [Sodiomyces alkalinus F11]ROT34485.1 PLP-dependent transferase [Sodiomyces alkalinus F11]